MHLEICSLVDHGTWELMPHPVNEDIELQMAVYTKI